MYVADSDKKIAEINTGESPYSSESGLHKSPVSGFEHTGNGGDVRRQWLGKLRLCFGYSANHKTVLASVKHVGPLRVQRPFYPEGEHCCHVYLLHPPGGMVLGDTVLIDVLAKTEAQVVLTTPSAGKFYGTKGIDGEQLQAVNLQVDEQAFVEWLPQETIIFNGANAHINTRVDLAETAKIIGWDMLRLGRVASGESFSSGTCKQSVELWRGATLLFRERLHLDGGAEMQAAKWGNHSATTLGTLYATTTLAKNTIDGLLIELHSIEQKYEDLMGGGRKNNDARNACWGLTQKPGIFLARYLGKSISACREGFELIWKRIRSDMGKAPAESPRIWNT